MYPHTERRRLPMFIRRNSLPETQGVVELADDNLSVVLWLDGVVGHQMVTAAVLPVWHYPDNRAGRLAARSRDTTSCSLSCWYRRANHRRTAEPLGRAHSRAPLGAGTGLVLCCPGGTNLKNHIEQNENRQNHSLYTSFVSLFLMSNAWIAVLTYSLLSESLAGCADLDGVPFLSMLCFFCPLF